MTLEAIIFDFDGVIVNTEGMHYQATIQALADEDIHFTYEVYLKKYIGIPDLLMFPQIGNTYGKHFHKDKIKELLHKKQKAYGALDLAKLPTCPGAAKLAMQASKILPLAICTGAHRVDIDRLLPYLNNGQLISCFQFVVTSDDVSRTKPNPEGYLQAAERLGKKPENCLVIEDTPVGIEAGKAAGMKVIGVCTSHHADQLYLADTVVNSLEDVNMKFCQELFTFSN